MKLKKIEEIATRPVPIWQPALLVSLLLLGIVAVPLIAKKQVPAQNIQSIGSSLGASDIKNKVESQIITIAKPLSDNLQKEAGVVMGIAQQAVQQTVQNIASQSANQAKEFVFDNTLGKVLQNIKTLPTDQQDLIKKAICK